MKKQPEITNATRSRIIDAFWILYKEKSIDKITVADITAITGNNRSTFYHYFQDVYDVLEQIEKDLLSEVSRDVQRFLTNKVFEEGRRDINILYSISMPIFKKNEDKIFTLVGKNGDPKFTDEFRSRMRGMLIMFWGLPKDTEHLDYLIDYTYSAMIGLMTKWYENGNDLNDEAFFKLAQDLLANGVLGYLQKQGKIKKIDV